MAGRRRSTVLLLAVLAVAVIAVVAVLSAAASRTSGTHGQAQPINPGIAMSRPAPGFTLTDEQGKPVSLRSYRGKVVILAFVDSRCTGVCPLTTTAMVNAKKLLGAAGKQVVLLGINANPKATRISDVQAYSKAHDMVGRWHFLTGSLHQLDQVWREYGVEAAVQHGEIVHTPALYVIDQRGQLRRQYVTEMAYAGVQQQAQDLAVNASYLLPSHPKVTVDTSNTTIPMIGPRTAVTLPRVGGGSVALGPGSSAHLLLFFDTWDSEVTNLARNFETLNRYQSAAALHGLPQLVAVDEASVESSSHALPRFLAGLKQPLRYPVALDRTGEVADGYRVQDEPWLELVSSTGKFLWYRDVGASGWLSTKKLIGEVHSALTHGQASSTAGSGAPTILSTLHAQANQLLGTAPALLARIKALHGYPVVLNAWASWCTPCRQEFPLLAAAAKRYGNRVAFLGANTNDQPGNAHSFLNSHPVGYPSYQDTTSGLSPLAVVEGLPTTVYIAPSGKVAFVHTGQYASQKTLDQDIQHYALGAGS